MSGAASERPAGGAAAVASGAATPPLAVAFGWHGFSFGELLDLVRQAERLGYRAAYVDGDVSQLPSRLEADVLDGWTVTTALLALTERIPIGSIRLVHHWNAARLAQAVATLERITPGRLRFLISIGGQRADRRFGLALPRARERIAWLDETLRAVRALWRGEEVTLPGRFVALEGARVRPVLPPGRPQIEVAGRGRRLLRVVAAHADVWDVNLPPVGARVARAAAHLEQACAALGRDPASIRRSMWIFVRPHGDSADPALRAEFRRWNPWYADLCDGELAEAIVGGPPAACRARLSEIARELGIALPVVDLSGLPYDAARRTLETLAPRESCVDSASWSA
jgi:alkanesulfonate monooxygenase SsuD/methylene tetrahydromethanopterin reductase-like flavin-dependent oxidoreductase (luciferase family)